MSDEHDGVSAGTSGDDPSGDEAKATSDKPVAGAARPGRSRIQAGAGFGVDDLTIQVRTRFGGDAAVRRPRCERDRDGWHRCGVDRSRRRRLDPDHPRLAGSARAAARRAAARAGTSEKKGEATPKRGSTTAVKPNPFARLGRFLREVVAELRKVIWPSRNQMVTYTIVVIAFVTFMVALVGVLDLLFAKGVFAVFG